jgi:hypothetical protein
VSQEGRAISELTQNEISIITDIAYITQRFSSTKAKKILERCCDLEIEGEDFPLNNPSKIYFSGDLTPRSNDIVDKVFSVFPNPSRGNISFLNTSSEYLEIEVSDLNGNEVFNFFIKPDEVMGLDEILAPGLYFAKTKHKGQQLTEEIVIID